MNLPWTAIRRDERPLTLALASTYLLVIGAFTLAKIARDSLFLTELPATYLPYVYVGLAALSAVAAVGLGRMRQGAAHQRLSFLLAATGLSLLLFALWFWRAPGSAAIVFYLWTGVYGVALVAEFWLLANERVDSRQARRLFGPVGAGGVLGGLLAGAAATAIGPFVDTPWFLVFAALSYLAAAVLVRRLPGGAEEEAAAPEQARERPGAASAKALLGSPYARLLVLVFLVAGLAVGVLDYAFKVVLQGEFGDSGTITSILGVFYSVQGVVSIIAQVGLTGLVLSRFGHRPAANALPAGLLLGGALAVGLPAFAASWAILGSRLYELAMRFSMTRTSWEFLYYPLSDEVKAKLKRLIDVVVNRSADAMAGLLLLGVNFALGGSLRQLAVLLFLLAAVWMVLELRLNRLYAQEVDSALRRLVPKVEEKAIELRRVARTDEVIDLLSSPEEDRVLSAMGILERLEPAAVLEQAPRLARHRSEAVRARLLAIVSACEKDPDDFELLAPGAARDPAGTSAAAAGLAETADERVAIAAAAGRPENAAAYRSQLDELISDPNEDVRRTAFRSVALAGDRSRLPQLLDRLQSSRDRRDVRRALILFGERIVGTLGDYLTDPAVAFGIRRPLIPVLEEIGGPEAAYSLYRASRLEGDRRITDGALRSLLRLRRRTPELRLPEPLILEDLRLENHRNGHRLIQLQTLRESEDQVLRGFLDRVVRERVDQSFLRIFRRLSLIHPEGPVMSAYRGLRSGKPRVRAQAIEYLDTLLPADLKRTLLPLVDARDHEERERQAVEIFGSEPLTLDATLRQLLRSREDWLKACGLFVVGRLELGEHRESARELSRSLDPVVRDTALWAIRRLG
jgi:AAA family ATP:ADP antiporter